MLIWAYLQMKYGTKTAVSVEKMVITHQACGSGLDILRHINMGISIYKYLYIHISIFKSIYIYTY